MAYQMTITLTDDEYTALLAEATLTGKLIEELLHERIAPHLHAIQATFAQTKGDEEFAKYLYREGIIVDIPTGESITAEEDDEIERLAHVFSGGKVSSDMVIEDRGPY